MSGLGPAGCWITHKGLETWARMAKERTTHKSQEFSVPKEQQTVQHSMNPEIRTPQESSPVLTHQSKSYPGGQPRLSRTPSVSSQGSLDSSFSRQGFRGSSPQIRTFAPDGRTTSSSALHRLHSADPGPTHGNSSSPVAGSNSRSPSPASSYRAESLDMRCSSPGGISTSFCGSVGDLRAMSPSQTSLTDTSVSNSPVPPPSPRGAALSRCLSPLLIPPAASRAVVSEPAPPASPLGALQPDLYQRRDGPLFLGCPNSGQSLGRLHLRLKYDFDRSDLQVHLIEAHDLARSDQGGFNDPYVRLSLLPAVDNRKRQTSHKKDPNPFFDQHFKFPVSHQDLQDKSLVLQVYDYDRFSRNDIVGEVRMSMDEFDVTSSVEVWGEITKTKKPPEEMQEILLSLSYLPSAERLTVVLLKARNLFLPQDKDNIDPFVKVYLLNGGKRVKKKKTAGRKGTCNPVWNEALTFNVTSSNLSHSALEVCVMDQGNDLIGNNPLLGCCVIGPDEEGPERDHWCDMTESPRKAVAMWHTLR
ncbi:synaptotagmin-5 [Periplaneta americana]|uniref:synaptotagmin-5 n=1 Tax=Periplaneta americana TaxID=6978 RepID=UPI0037E7861D